MRVDINNLMTISSFKKAKNISYNTVKKAIDEQRLAILTIDGYDFIVINKRAAEFQPERRYRGFNFYGIEVKPPVYYDTDKLLNKKSYATLKKVAVMTVSRWVKNKQIDVVTIDGYEFIVVNNKSASIHSDRYFN